MADNENKLGQEILDDAKLKGAHAVERAEREAGKLVAAVREKQKALRADKMAAAAKTADDKIGTLRAVLDVEKRRLSMLSREKVIQAVLEKAAEAVASRDGIDRARSLRELLLEAAAAVGSPNLTVRMRPEDIALLGERAVVEIALQSYGPGGQAVVTPDPALGGGVIVATADGKRRFDNTPAARRHRFEKTLRPRIASELGL